MLDLSNITLVSVNCLNPVDSMKALQYSSKDIKFKEIVLFTNENLFAPNVRTILIDKFDSINGYSDFILTLYKYFTDTDYILLIQDDGFIVNPDNWDNDFLNYDYIGAPWPAERDWVNLQQTKEWMPVGFNQVGNGGFSLRSNKFLKASSIFTTCKGYGEDAWLCTVNYKYMLANGIKFPSIQTAKKFSYENPLRNWDVMIEFDANNHFGFHGRRFTNSQQLIDLKN